MIQGDDLTINKKSGFIAYLLLILVLYVFIIKPK